MAGIPIGKMARSNSAAGPVAARSGRHFGDHGYVRPLAGLLTVVVLTVIVAVAIGLFRGSFSRTVPVTVVADRAGLEMYPEAKVKLNGAQVGKVASIDQLPDGRAALRLAIDPGSLDVIPANVGAAITSSTVFGAKFVELVPPADPSPAALMSGTVIQGEGHVTVELNTVFQQLVSVLSTVDPAKLNQTLGAVSTALSGRGAKTGQMVVDSGIAEKNPLVMQIYADVCNRPMKISRSAQTCNCSMAAARKVSPAAISTLAPWLFNSAAILPSVVVLPEPLTPTNSTT